MEGPSSLNRALEHSLQHLLLCMHRSSALTAVARILGFGQDLLEGCKSTSNMSFGH